MPRLEMGKRSLRWIQLGILITILLPLSAQGLLAPSPARTQNGTLSHPCRASVDRYMYPSSVEPGDRIDLELRYRYDCRPIDEEPTLFVMLVVPYGITSKAASPTLVERDLRAGLGALIEQLPWSRRSRLGVVVYGFSATVARPLGQGEAHRKGLVELIDHHRLLSEPPGGTLGFDRAVDLALGEIPAALMPGEVSLIVAIDLGAEDFSGPGDGCRAAGRAGVRVALAQLADAEDRAAGCVNAGIWTADRQDKGLDERLRSIAATHYHPGMTVDPPLALRVREEIDGSLLDSLPIPAAHAPRQTGDRLSWDIPLTKTLETGVALPYALRADDPATVPLPARRSSSRDLHAELVLSSGVRQPLALAPLEVCVARPGHLDEDCGPSLPPIPFTPTPAPPGQPSPMPSATPSTTPITSPSPTATPSAATAEASSVPPSSPTSTLPSPELLFPLLNR